MSAPTRTLCCPPPLRNSVLPGTRTFYAAASTWGSGAAIECRYRPSHPLPTKTHARNLSTTPRRTFPRPSTPRNGLATVQDSKVPIEPLPVVWFTAHPPLLSPNPSNKPPDERKVKLGKTLRILQERLPTLLQSPLPQEVLSPHITLHLFPSTHPHLPTVTGRVAYIAALWSSPIAWNRVPLVGNVRLEILSERMVDHPIYPTLPGGRRPEGACSEQLIVRWRTVGGGGSRIVKGLLSFVGNGNGRGKGNGQGEGPKGVVAGSGIQGKDGEEKEGGSVKSEAGGTEVKAPVGMAQPAGTSNKEFTGLFIFDFDGEGRILSHTIEHVQEGGQWEKGVGAKVVGLTDWLLGGIKGADAPCPAFARARWRKGRE
ncbi:uncharacterized protein B0T15DRAFT_238168 [Chaetomium strumarium]|uniref:Uncharacterized protein n=1 Tax=Chaetomium strumarium TaxID=1170767 RepID=A0AAJ0M0D5_9PEZI|nr:hypothetical protein B0T15DRAFT_238168 [Chaetomium strumarium]